MDVFSLADRTDDESLIIGFAVNDEQAATAFVRRFQSPVFGLAFSVTRDVGLAEEVSQEVFVRAWRAAGNYDSRRGSVLTWLLTITRNAAIDVVRTRRAVPATDDALDFLLAATVGSASTDEVALLSLESRRAAERLRALPVDQARAVAMAVIGGCTAAEVARREGVPLGTAKTRIRTGLHKLRDSLKEDSHDRDPSDRR